MGRAVNGLKPEAIRQIFGPIDDFKDVRNVVGKGIKRYRMKGLYGAPTQCALAVCDGILTSKKKFQEETIENFKLLSHGGSEDSFGVFRSPEGCLWKAVDLLEGRKIAEPSSQNSATGLFTTLSTPLALYQKKWSKTLANQCLETCLIFSSHPLEVVGTVLNGFLVTRLLALEGEDLISVRKEVLLEAEEICSQAETEYQKRIIESEEEIAKSRNAFSRTLKELATQIEKPEKEVLQWIVDNASSYTKREIRHASQAFVLTLIPLALYWLLSRKNSLTSILNQGRETEKLGALVGAWEGALTGNIPESWKTGLVNSREIRLRGEALFQRRIKKDMKAIADMETALTAKELEEAKRHQPKEIKKSPMFLDVWEDEEFTIPSKEDRAKWRKFQKEKAKSKRDRRKNLPDDFI